MSQRFVRELTVRRDKVYEYLLNWPGAELFQPEDIHEGLYSYVRHSGKGLRPALLMLSARAAGGDEEQALPAAAAVEIFHIWTLVHDDVIDRDATRRGHPTVHAAYSDLARAQYGLSDSQAAHYGTTVAILSGDLQQGWSFGLLCDLLERGVAPPVVLRLVRRMANVLTPHLLEGEMLDVQYSLRPPFSVSRDHILQMLTRKTAALLEYCAWAGAEIGLNGRPDAQGLTQKLPRFAALCGTAFQLRDDVLGLTADASQLGKPIGSDLREGKRTLVLHEALSSLDGEKRAALMSVIGSGETKAASLEAAMEHIRESGALERVSKLADSLISQALALLDDLDASDSVSLLREWAAYLLSRSS